ncbi:MAG: cell division protein FtsA [Nitrospira sp.]|nr:cell division protein FtsA [Nitrospira sp.]
MGRRDHVVVGLDIGTTKICAVVAEMTEDGTVNIIGVGSSPSRGLKKGVVVDIDLTVDSIKKAVEEAELMTGGQINAVYTGIAGSHISVAQARGVLALKRQEVTRQDVDRVMEQVRAGIMIEPGREILHVIPREFVVDDQDGVREPLGMSGARLAVEAHIITGAVTSVQNISKSVNRAGLDVVEIVLQPLASSEAVLSSEERDLGVVMVDLGGGTTDLAIFVDGSIRHTAVLPIGGQNLTKDIAIGLLTSQTEAEKIKIKHGIARVDLVGDGDMVEVPSAGDRPARSIPRRELALVIEPRVEEMFELVRDEINHAGYDGRLGAGVVITGGTSMLEGMPDAAERVLNLPARRGVPTGVDGLRDIAGTPMHATAVGLILHACHHMGDLESVGRGGRRVGRAFGRMRQLLQEFF